MPKQPKRQVPLTDPWFEASFYGKVTPEGVRHYLDSIEGAQGLHLWCPCGYGKAEYPLEGGRPHQVMVPFSNPRNAPQLPANHGPIGRDGKHPRWALDPASTEIGNVTVTPSVAVGHNPECWHGFITGGIVREV